MNNLPKVVAHLRLLKHLREIPMVSSPGGGRRMQVGYEKNRDYRPIYCVISEMIQDRAIGTFENVFYSLKFLTGTLDNVMSANHLCKWTQNRRR